MESRDFHCPETGAACNITECAAHKYVMEILTDTKALANDLSTGQRNIEKAIIMLTENQSEMRRMGERWDAVIGKLEAKDLSQDAEIFKNQSYINRAIGAVASVSFLSIIISSISALFLFLFKGG